MGRLGLGLVLSVITLIVGLCGGPAYAIIGTVEFTGALGGAVAMVLIPITFSLTMAWFGIVMFLPFKLLLKLRRGVWLRLDMEQSELENAEV